MRTVLFFFVTIFFVFCVMRWNFFALNKNTSFLLVADSVLSVDCCASIEQEIACNAQKNISSRQLIENIKQAFPILDSVSLSYCACKNIVKVRSYQPLFIINHEWVLAENKRLFKKSFFSLSILDGIVSVNISQKYKDTQLDELCALLQNLPDGCFDQYNWYCMDKNCIQLTDKNNSNFTIVYSKDRVISPLMLSQCEAVKNNIFKHEVFDKSATWIVDTRFANYIVAYKA